MGCIHAHVHKYELNTLLQMKIIFTGGLVARHEQAKVFHIQYLLCIKNQRTDVIKKINELNSS